MVFDSRLDDLCPVRAMVANTRKHREYTLSVLIEQYVNEAWNVLLIGADIDSNSQPAVG